MVPWPPHSKCFVGVGGEGVAAVGVDEEHASHSEQGYVGLILVKLTIEFFVRSKFVVVV